VIGSWWQEQQLDRVLIRIQWQVDRKTPCSHHLERREVRSEVDRTVRVELKS
jgi:hypothetical protein